MKSNYLNPHLIFLFFLGLASCQNNQKAIVKEFNFYSDSLLIAEAFSAQLQSWNEGSVEGFMNAYHRDSSLKFITSKGITYGWNQVRDNYLRVFPNQEKMGKLNFLLDGYEQISDSIMHTTGIWEVAYPDTSRSGYFSLFWKNIPDQGWKIIVDHTW